MVVVVVVVVVVTTGRYNAEGHLRWWWCVVAVDVNGAFQYDDEAQVEKGSFGG